MLMLIHFSENIQILISKSEPILMSFTFDCRFFILFHDKKKIHVTFAVRFHFENLL